MSKLPDNIIKLSETLTLCKYESGGNAGFWLHDETQGVNLAIRAKTETEAFVEALHYYQKRLKKVEQDHDSLKTKVDIFVSQFAEDDRDWLEGHL